MRRRDVQNETTEKLNFWLSYSDMMAALLLTFVLILSGTLLNAQKTYEEKQAELEEKQAELEEKEAVIAHQQTQIDTIVGIRGDLVSALSKEFSGNEMSVKVDAQTGAITFDSSLLFGFDDDQLQKAGEEFLNQFLPKYFSILLGDDFLPYVAEVIIEGHTDTHGEYMYNLRLSQNRALAVSSYCLEHGAEFLTAEQLNELRGLLTANGRSFSAPVYTADGTVDMDASRRVEIKFRLKDDEMMDEIAAMLEAWK